MGVGMKGGGAGVGRTEVAKVAKAANLAKTSGRSVGDGMDVTLDGGRLDHLLDIGLAKAHALQLAGKFTQG